jgi:hypothetical protein
LCGRIEQECSSQRTGFRKDRKSHI